jgi:hypothetical protein
MQPAGEGSLDHRLRRRRISQSNDYSRDNKARRALVEIYDLNR